MLAVDADELFASAELDSGLVVVVVERADLQQEGSLPVKEFHSLDVA